MLRTPTRTFSRLVTGITQQALEFSLPSQEQLTREVVRAIKTGDTLQQYTVHVQGKEVPLNKPGAALAPRQAHEIIQKYLSRVADVAIIGSPNCGKSTLMNALTGDRISAVSRKMNTTTRSTLGILTQDHIQLVFHDTPGIVPPSQIRKGKKVFVGDSWQSVNESDVTLFMLDAAKLITQTEYFILQKLGQMERNQDKKLALVLNKIDIVRPRSKIAKIIEELSKVTEFDAVFPISALNQTGVDQLKMFLQEKCSRRDKWRYSSTKVTDLTQKERIEEMVREQIYRQLNQEIPYASCVKLEGYKKLSDGTLVLGISIYVEHDRHRRILIGSKGEVLKRIIEKCKPAVENVVKTTVQLRFSILVDKTK